MILRIRSAMILGSRPVSSTHVTRGGTMPGAVAGGGGAACGAGAGCDDAPAGTPAGAPVLTKLMAIGTLFGRRSAISRQQELAGCEGMVATFVAPRHDLSVPARLVQPTATHLFNGSGTGAIAAVPLPLKMTSVPIHPTKRGVGAPTPLFVGLPIFCAPCVR